MKKYIVYFGVLAVGLLLGWLLFGNSTNKEPEHNHDEVVETNQMWTCSMHPQIMQPEPGDCPICGMDLIPAEVGADGLSAEQFKMTENALALANIQTSIVGSEITKDNMIKLSGKIAENEEANAVQVSYFSGRIERLNISFTGEEVRKGQLLASIYSPDLYAAQQELITAASLKESQPDLYKAVRNKLKLWKLSENQINRIEETGKVQENFPVYATVSGTVSEKLVEQGDYIKQGQPLLKIANLNTVWAVFDVYENQIDLFKKGQEVSIVTNAYPNKEFITKVDFIDPILDTKTRTVKLRAVLNNKGELFKPGMFVEGNIKGKASSLKQAVTIPSSAILWTGERSVVYIKTNPEQPVFEMREVDLGNHLGDNYEVLSGLNNGDEIVTNGTFTIDAAAQLQGKKSMMNRDGSRTSTGHEGHGMLKDNEGASTDNEHTIEKIKADAPTSFIRGIELMVTPYLKLKDQLVMNQSEEAGKSAGELLIALNSLSTQKLNDKKTESYWLNLNAEIKSAAQAVKSASEIEQQRKYFKPLSASIIETVKTFGISETIYIQFCPMADSNAGGSWLSSEEEIRNPYFGDKMLKCGKVTEIIGE